MNKNILILLIGNYDMWWKSTKTISSLQKENYKITLISTEFSKDDNLSDYNFPIHIIKKTGGVFLKKFIEQLFFIWKLEEKLKMYLLTTYIVMISALWFMLGFFLRLRWFMISWISYWNIRRNNKIAIRMIEN